MRKQKDIKRPAQTDASCALVDYVVNNSTIKLAAVDPVISRLQKDHLWDYFDEEDALKRFLGVALFAAKEYVRDARDINGDRMIYKHLFRVNDRRAAAAALLDYYMSEITDH